MLDRMLLAAGGDEKLYVEDVFSTYLYTGNGTGVTVNNGIDLSGKGGMVWVKSRSNTHSNRISDTANGVGKYLFTDSTAGMGTQSAPYLNIVGSFTSTGFTYPENTSGWTYASWTFRKAPKFFDVVTWTGDGTTRNIPHNLGVAPGCIIVKRTDVSGNNWVVYHRSRGASEFLTLNTTNATSFSGIWDYTSPTSTVFTVTSGGNTNASGSTYVAYLFAHDATADGIIQCGSFTATNGSASTVNLGWEPQWLMMKVSSSSGDDWKIFDNMRGLNAPTQNAALLKPNTSEQEYSGAYPVYATSTGFTTGTSLPNDTFIYIAIRRGPMRTPTSGTSVFSPVTYTGNASSRTLTSGFPVDLQIQQVRNQAAGKVFVPRITGGRDLDPTIADAEGTSYTGYLGYDNNTGINYKNSTSYSYFNAADGKTYLSYFFRRAPSFFDVVAYTGNGVNNRNIPHNLGAVPEMVIYKSRSLATDWNTYVSYIGATNRLQLNTDTFKVANGYGWNNTDPTATNLILGGSGYGTNNNGATYVAYLFASCPGVSKVGSYTGNGSSQTINCGFSSGARFFLVKRTDSTGDWWVYDSARGIVAAADPALRLNSTAAEVTSADAVDTNSTGIIVNQEATCNINVNGATYIYLAIA